tara:strand:- start:153 stop:341 length:189 start_codon:yes stop_codon:yes gene_type:complete
VEAFCQAQRRVYVHQRRGLIKEKIMPTVGKKKFPYTKAGKKKAEEYKKKAKKKAKKKTKKKA